MPKSVENPPSAEPKAYPPQHRSLPTLKPWAPEEQVAEAVEQRRATDTKPEAPPPDASAPVSSASAVPAAASEKASAAATALVIFKVVTYSRFRQTNVFLYRLLVLARPPMRR